MPMSRQDYQLLAEEINQMMPPSLQDSGTYTAEQKACEETMMRFTRQLASRLKTDNPLFDRHRFIAACEE